MSGRSGYDEKIVQINTQMLGVLEVSVIAVAHVTVSVATATDNSCLSFEADLCWIDALSCFLESQDGSMAYFKCRKLQKSIDYTGAQFSDASFIFKHGIGR
ncbi:hypothetical protein HS088_TW06G01040 [Tripterygium wilfordii]|uniref:Uncharacterized protein n=1 Tax=Tripterygium wilfordii TaxID=458696 RepID=A0A7J7DKV0_TRIWF|nr:hypothetical protein HS088_TW06G01040 [Tripterygium wilfordii]